MRRILVLSLVVFSAVASAATSATFSQGSLIIPMQANFQTGCGSTSTYGLVWKLLYENRSGGVFAGAPITINWIISDTKASPNRCVPTNKHTSPTPNSRAPGTAGWDNAAGAGGAWTDGCDLSIPNGAGVESIGKMPVVNVDYGLPFPSTGLYDPNAPTSKVQEFNTTGGLAQPSYDTATATAGKGKRPAAGALDNSGSCTAAPCINRFSKVQYMGGVFVIDSSDAKRVIEAMKDSTMPHLGIHAGISSPGCPLGGNYTVVMHQAMQSFDAPVYKRITRVPPKIALLDFGGGISTVLQKYLNNAGLMGNIGTDPVAGTPSSGTTGLVYDRLNAIADLVTTGTYPNGYLNSKVGSRSRYKVYWAPHWEVDDPALGTTAQVANALDNIAFFADQKGNGVMAECASIEGYEGSTAGIPTPSTKTDFMYENLSNTTKNLVHNGLNNSNGRNCTDPDYLASTTNPRYCTKYPYPSDPFVQIGDFSYSPTGGHVSDFRRASTGTRRSGVRRLANSWTNLPTAGTDDSGDNGWDFFTLRQKDNDPEKATIIYVAGHDLSGDVAGSRVVLNTLLNLGADPIPSDRSSAAPVGFLDGTNSNLPTLVSSVYSVLTGTMPPGSSTYDKSTGKAWRFPFTGGNLRVRNAAAIQNGENELNDYTLYAADAAMPAPTARNLFTYFGGYAQESPTLTGSRRVKNDVAQLGWKPERIEYNRLNDDYSSSPNTACTDVQKYGDYKDKVTGANTSGLVPGSDGICDLQQALMWRPFVWDVSAGNHSFPPGQVSQLKADVPDLQQFVQLVRGHCYATRSELGLSGTPDQLFEPSDSNCTDMGGYGENLAHLGGAVRSTAAVVPASTKVPSAAGTRPTVAYVGTWDGQLHAIYMGGGSGYTGPAGGRSYLNPDATCSNGGCVGGLTTTFRTNYASNFASGTLPARGTELWAYLPATQLPHLKQNNARVDSSPVVQDVFVDLSGDGIKRWHTVLVASVGPTGRELFAMDVTNPLKPVLLWDIVGSNFQSASNYPPFPGVAMFDYDKAGAAKPLEWDNTLADFLLPPVLDTGRTVGFPYDYTDLGGSRALSIGQMREGLEPTYAVFVASNASGYGAGSNDAQGRSMSKGLVVHAIDIGTGQKLWKWKQPYVNDSTKAGYRMADNTVPPPVSIVNSAEGAGTLYVGDMEGRIWELNASTGQNLNALRDATCTSPSCNFAAFDTRPGSCVSPAACSPEPITSNLAITRLPTTTTASTPLAPYPSEMVMVVGTGGTDWVPSTVGGKVHTLLLNSTRRKPVRTGGAHLPPSGSAWTLTDARDSAMSNGPTGETGGLLQNPEDMPLVLTVPYRVYGNITISGSTAFVPLVQGAGGDPLNIAKTLGGKTLDLPLGNLPATQAAGQMTGFNYANFGGVAVMEVPQGGSGPKDVWVVGDEVSKTAMRKDTNGGANATRTQSDKTLSKDTALPYRLYNSVRRFFSQQ